MNYVRYEPETGDIKAYGFMPTELIENEIARGNPILLVENVGDFSNWKVNLETKELERINPDEPLPEIPQEIRDLFANSGR